MIPVSTSPVPAVASAVLSVRFTTARPSGAAMTVPGPFSRHDRVEPGREVARRGDAIGIHAPCSRAARTRPACGVRIAGGSPAARRAVQRLGIGRERVQRVGVDHDRDRARGDQSAHRGLGARVAPEPGSDREHAEALDVGEHRLGRVRVERAVGSRGQRTRHELAAARTRRGFATGNAAHHHAGTDPRRRVTGQHRRARQPRRPADDEHARRPLVPVGGAHRQREVGRRPSTCRRAVAVQTRVASMPMSATCTRPARVRPGFEQQPRLERGEAHGFVVRDTASPRTSPVVPSTPDGMSTASVAIPDAGERGRDARRVAFEHAPEPGAEHGVDREVGARPIARRSAASSMPSASANSSTPTPRARNSRAATTPSAPLLPRPQTTTTRRP